VTLNTRAKWAYLSYDSMVAKIQDGTLDSYDVCYCPDTKENYIISPELEPWAVRSKVYVFSTIEEANTQLNINTDTYIGQIVSILNGDVCKGYIVNKNTDGSYYVDAITSDNIDYNVLGNRPIVNIVGTLDETIIITTLSPGLYKVKGQYKISDLEEETTYLSVDGDLFLVDTDYIKRITKDFINNYIINEDSIIKETYVTDKYLENKGYTTTNYVDSKVAALEESIKADIQSYVESTVEDVITQKVDTIIDERLDVKLEEKIQPVSNDDVTSLFS
jgi:hypothetical protein